MIRSFKSITTAAMLLVTTLVFTSCEGALDDIFGEWSRPGTVTSISLTSTTQTLVVGEADVTLTYTIEPDNAIDKTVTWSSDNTAVATVDATGRVHAVAVGTAIITAKAGDKLATCTVTVTEVYAANEYNEGAWDSTNEKVVFTKQTAASVTAVANSDADVTWDAGWYTVSGNVTITGNVTLGADTHLILQDGATLTINGQLDCNANSKNLYIYGQKKGDGKLNVTNNSFIAINSNNRIDIHGGEVTASATGDYKIGLCTGYLAVYGGKLTATSGGGHGICFINTIDVYGGVVEATSNATSNNLFGIVSGGGTSSQILTVYGGKVTATGSGIDNSGVYGSGFGGYVKSGTSGIKFYFSADGTNWGDGTSYASATSVGQQYDADATKKQFAKAE